MKKIALITAIFLSLSCQFSVAQKNNNKDVQTAKNVKVLIAKMTLQEKIEQLTQDAPINKRLGIPMMIYSECLHGLWLKGATVYPQAIALGSTWEPFLIKEMTIEIAKESRAVNITHCYSPNLDVISGDARYGRVEESYGEDPYLVSKMGVAFIQGLQGEGKAQFDENHIIATAKHFVAYPENRRGINGGFVDMSIRRLYEVYLPPFEAAVKEAKVGSLMPGHEDLNGIPCHANTWLLNDLLRKQWGFEGFIVSDNNDVSRLQLMHHIAKNRTEAAVLGLKAGVDMDLVIGKSEENSAYTYAVLKDTLKSNPSLVKYIDQSVSRILTMKYKLGLFDQGNKTYNDTIVSKPESQNVALKIAEKAIILLKNDSLPGQDHSLLPLDINKLKSIAVIGPNAAEVLKGGRYTQMGSYSGIPPYFTSVLEGITQKAAGKFKVNYAKGCDLTSFSKDGFPEAIDAAKKSEVVLLVVGGSTETCGEGLDRDDLDLYGVQKDLVKAIYETGKPVIVMLLNGRPLSINFIAKNIPAVFEGWYLGMRTGEAVANVIFGNVNPGGKLTVSIPRFVGQLPVTYLEKPDFIGTGKGQYMNADKSPLFSFGYGLSYTNFRFSNLRLASNKIKAGEKTKVTVDITNTGERPGDEVVQMYVHEDVASVGRFFKMLKGFGRITLKPGETKTVQFELNADNLSLYNVNMKKVVEPGDFTISVGSSSLDKDLQKIKLTVIQ